MKFQVTNPKFGWHLIFKDKIFEVCDGYEPDHPQIPAMTQYGRTWFDIDAVTIIESE